MHKIFISGSIKIKRLDNNVLDRINNIIESSYQIFLGDANGVDRAIQEYLHAKEYVNVKIYCTGNRPRNNTGNWLVEHVSTTAAAGTRAFFTAKDLRMAEDCDYGLMVWDSQSTGTLSNVIELLKRNKYSIVYINKKNEFLTIKKPSNLASLISFMSVSDKNTADKKIGLTKKIESLQNEQSRLFN